MMTRIFLTDIVGFYAYLYIKMKLLIFGVS